MKEPKKVSCKAERRRMQSQFKTLLTDRQANPKNDWLVQSQ